MFKCRACQVNQSESEYRYFTEKNNRNQHVICYDCYISSEEKTTHETGASWVKMTEERMKGNKKDWYTGGDYYHAHKVSI